MIEPAALQRLLRCFGRAASLLAVAAAGLPAPAVAAPVQFKAADGIVVHGDLQRPAGRPRGTILLFHQAGSNLAEYAPIAPVLVRAGFATLAIDQRSGGQMWGRGNATAAATAASVKGDAGYAAALPDLGAALAQASVAGMGPVIVWGSSYSAALVFLLAAAHPDIAAVLAFSPGEYIDGRSIAGAAARLTVPVFVTSAADREEIAAAREIAAAVPGGRGTQFVPRAGVHGSSTLRQDRDPAGAAANWAAVMAFLDKVAPPAK